LREKSDKKKELIYRDELPASVLQELVRKVIQLKTQLRAQAGAAAQAT